MYAPISVLICAAFYTFYHYNAASEMNIDACAVAHCDELTAVK